jgi:hypothetical protein
MTTSRWLMVAAPAFLLATGLGLTGCDASPIAPICGDGFYFPECSSSGAPVGPPAPQSHGSLSIVVRPDTLRFDVASGNPRPQMLYIHQHTPDGIYRRTLVSVTSNRRVTVDGPWERYTCSETIAVCTGYAFIRRDTLEVTVRLDASGLEPGVYGNISVEACDGQVSPTPACDANATRKPMTVRAWWFQSH